MNISFDLDSTLISNGDKFETEKVWTIAKLFGVEKIRKGSSKLIKDLSDKGYKINIYTTSFRSKKQIRRTFKYHKIKIHRIVNQKENQLALSKIGVNSSKYPKAFGFDIHIDDSEGVGIESKKFAFKAIIISTEDKNWVNTIKKEIQIMEKESEF